MTKQTTVTTQPVNNLVKGQTREDLIQRYGTKSATIRALTAEGWTRSEIAKVLGIRYQHVRNVLVTILKKDQPK